MTYNYNLVKFSLIAFIVLVCACSSFAQTVTSFKQDSLSLRKHKYAQELALMSLDTSNAERLTNKATRNNVNFLKFGGIVGLTAGTFVWLHNYQSKAWWSGQRGNFHIQFDWAYSLSADKVGHFFDGAFIQNLYQGAFEWSGFNQKTAMWMGAMFSIIYMTDVEIEDGYAKDWGFSPGDEAANIAGAFYPVLQDAVPQLRSFNFKWSYYPSEELRKGTKDGAFIDDYNGQTMWLSIGIDELLPKKAKPYWPDFLNLCFGYGVDNYQNFDKRYQNFYVGLDLDWRKIIPGNSKFMIWFKNVVNHFRFFPLPAIRFNKNRTEYIVNY